MSKRRRTSSSTSPRSKPREVFVPRPFEGLPAEGEWIALRELVPAATAPLRLAAALVERFGERPVLLATLLPMAVPAVSRADGQVLLAVQRHAQSGDPSRDLAVALECALQAAPGEPVDLPALPGGGPRLQDLLVGDALDVTVHDSFAAFWLAGGAGAGDDPALQASLERADASIYPTVKLSAAPAAYWCRVPDRAHVRWVLTDDEDRALQALARLHAAGELSLGERTRFAGMFRAHGRLVPVWDLPREPDAAAWEAPLAELVKRYAEAAAATGAITPAERRARQGLIGRQLTLR